MHSLLAFKFARKTCSLMKTISRKEMEHRRIVHKNKIYEKYVVKYFRDSATQENWI